jgi:hypothetical protein
VHQKGYLWLEALDKQNFRIGSPAINTEGRWASDCALCQLGYWFTGFKRMIADISAGGDPRCQPAPVPLALPTPLTGNNETTGSSMGWTTTFIWTITACKKLTNAWDTVGRGHSAGLGRATRVATANGSPEGASVDLRRELARYRGHAVSTASGRARQQQHDLLGAGSLLGAIYFVIHNPNNTAASLPRKSTRQGRNVYRLLYQRQLDPYIPAVKSL